MLLSLNYILLLISSLGFSYPGSSPDYNLATVSPALKENAYAIIRTHETTFTVKSIHSATEKVKYAVTILDEKAADKAMIQVPYDKFNKVNYLRGTLYNQAGKEIKKLKSGDIQDISMNTIANSGLMDDNRLKVANLSAPQYPYTVEFEYEITYKGLLFYPTWAPQDEMHLSVEKASFQVELPQGFTFRSKEVNISQKAEIATAGSSEVHTWQVKDLKAREPVPYGPSLSEMVPVVYTAPTDFEIDGFKGNMNTWADFGKWINQLNKNKEILPEATVTKIKALVADAPDDLTKIQKLYEYMQGKTRYVSIQLGIGGWQPFEANFVDSKGYGDCKALSNYMHALLKAAGINSYYTLIKAGEGISDMRVDFPSNQFNHAVLCVPMAKDSVWLECTNQTVSWGYAGSFTGDRHALLITPEGGKVVRTPVYKPSDNMLKRSATVKLDPTGNAIAQVTTNYTGLQQDEISNVALAGAEDQKKWLYNEISLPNFAINKFSFDKQKGKIPVVTENLTLNINKYGTLTGKRLFLTPNLLNQLTGIPPKTDNRTEMVVIEEAFQDQDIIQYEIPADIFQAEMIPEPQTIKSKFGEYAASVKMENNKLVYTRTLQMQKGRYPSTAYPELLDFYKKINKADRMQVVFATK